MRYLATCALPDGSKRACIVPEGSDVPLGWATICGADGVPLLRRAWAGTLYEALIPLKFEKIKAIAYPNAKQFAAYDECEQNPFAEGCPE